jgi:ferredoxin
MPNKLSATSASASERADVCDQCGSLPGNRAACVYACPQDVALRVDAWVDFPQV